MLYAWKKFGLLEAEKHYIEKYRSKKILPRHQLKIDSGKGEFFIKVIKGRINFIKMVRGEHDPIYKKLAYQLTEAFGKPNASYLKTRNQIASDSVFVLENNFDISQGTAFLLDGIGIVSNCHVVENIDMVTVSQVDLFRHDEISVKRKIKYQNSSMQKDLSLFQPVGDYSDIKALKIGDDSKIQNGTNVIVIGYPQYNKGDEPYINTSKVVQSAMHFGKKIWLIDSPIIHGNSGGPVFNSNLEVIGIATAGSENNSATTKFNGFIPISTLLDFVASP
jgi:S1-C subfamily serine protease